MILSKPISSIVQHGVMLAINYLITLSVSIGTVEMCGLSPYFGVVFCDRDNSILQFLLMKRFVFVREEDVK